MPIDKDVLDAIAHAYVADMTSIRGRRVHQLLMREFARFDHVLMATAEDGTHAVLAVGEDGSAAVCRTDGRGAQVAVAAWARLTGATITTSYDMTKDSLPVVSWTVGHPSLAPVGGALTIGAAGLPSTDHVRISRALYGIGR